MGLHLSGIVAAIFVLPAALTILLGQKLPLPLTLTFGHISLVGFAVALATTDQFAGHSTQLLGKVRACLAGLIDQKAFFCCTRRRLTRCLRMWECRY